MDFITFELRPRLQSCNVYLVLKEGVNPKDVRFVFGEQSMELIINDDKYPFVLPPIKFLPESLSSLEIQNRFIYFRLQTTPAYRTFGSCSTEVVTINSIAEKDISIAKENETRLKDVECLIGCGLCANTVSNVIRFKRVLPLPLFYADPSEWYCCSHTAETSERSMLEPRETECFYTPFYKLVHREVLKKKVAIHERHIACTRCMLSLGYLETPDTCKLWNTAVFYTTFRDTELLFTPSDPTRDFVLAFRTHAKNYNKGTIVFQFNAEVHKYYLLVKPMDTDLNLFIEPEIMYVSNVNTLKKMHVAKVLYMCKTGITLTDEDRGDGIACEISAPTFFAGVKYLLESSERFSPAHRHADGGFFIGYVNIEDYTT